MSGRKTSFRFNCLPTQSHAAGATGAVRKVDLYDTLAISGTFTGNPVGNLLLEGSLDYNPNNPSAATWFQMGTIAVSAAGTVGNSFANTGAIYARERYAQTSGTGNITGWMAGKMV